MIEYSCSDGFGGLAFRARPLVSLIDAIVHESSTQAATLTSPKMHIFLQDFSILPFFSDISIGIFSIFELIQFFLSKVTRSVIT
jgi:hypothetical protein